VAKETRSADVPPSVSGADIRTFLFADMRGRTGRGVSSSSEYPGAEPCSREMVGEHARPVVRRFALFIYSPPARLRPSVARGTLRRERMFALRLAAEPVLMRLARTE
jgi:hypothetical protein